MSRFLPALLLILPVACGGQRASPPRSDSHVDVPASPSAVGSNGPVPVAANRGSEIHDGFRGDVHPALNGGARLAVSAHWTQIGTGRAYRLGYFPAQFYKPFRGLRVAAPLRVYSAREFSAFLPQSFDRVGQVWALDLDRIAAFLKQFHTNASLRLAAPGRRAGPEGGFAILRSIAPTHYEIVFRLHAEFQPAANAWYTPAYFAGTVLVNRQAGTVEFFRLALPTDRLLNATLTVRLPTEALIDIVRVERMELIGGETDHTGDIQWDREIDVNEAFARLRQVFYKFAEIDWVAPDIALAVARQKNKAVLAVVLWGGLDEQSC